MMMKGYKMWSKSNSSAIRTFLLHFNKYTVKEYGFGLYCKVVVVYFHSEHPSTNKQIHKSPKSTASYQESLFKKIFKYLLKTKET